MYCQASRWLSQFQNRMMQQGKFWGGFYKLNLSFQTYDVYNQLMEVQSRKEQFIKIIRRYQLIYKICRKWRKKTRSSKHRLNILRQWLDTQLKYTSSLNLIIQQIQRPLIQHQVLTMQQIKIVFPNFSSIRKLSQQLTSQLRLFIKEWHQLKTEIAPILIKYNSFFKIYIEICRQYYVSQRILNSKKDNEDFIRIETRLITKYKCGIDSFMIKPIQRLGKYVLFLQDYLKHLPKNHIDYDSMKIAVQKYRQINQINDDSIIKNQINEKLVNLQKIYDKLLKTPRQYVRQFQAIIVEHQVHIYVFKDLLLITRQTIYGESLEKAIQLDGNSFISLMPNGKYYQHILFICGKNTGVTLLFANYVVLSSIYEQLWKLLQQLRIDNQSKVERVRKHYSFVMNNEQQVEKKLQQLRLIYPAKICSQIRISTIGVQVFPSSLINNQVLYILKFELPEPSKLCNYIYIEYEALLQFYQKISREYPDIPFVHDINPSTFDVNYIQRYKNKSRIIEFRMMSIQIILNTLFRSRVIPDTLIKQYLPINNIIWNFKIQNECSCKQCKFQAQQFNIQNYLKSRAFKIKNLQRLSEDEFCIQNYAKNQIRIKYLSAFELDTLQKILVYIQSCQGRINYLQIQKPICFQNLMVQIKLLNISKDEYIKVKIDKNITVNALLGMACRSLGIFEYQDFGLFIDYDGIPRLLDGDQNICAIVENEIVQIQNQKQQFFDLISNTIKYLRTSLSNTKKSRIYLRKYIFLQQKLEAQSFKNTPSKRRLMVEQIFYFIAHQQIFFDVNLEFQIYALFISLREIERIHNISVKNFPKQTLYPLLTQQKRKLLKQGKFLSEIVSKIDKIRKTLCLQINKVMRIEEQIILISNVSWCSTACMFPVNPYDNVNNKALLGVNFKNLFIVKKEKIEPIIVVPLQDLRLRITPFSIFFDGEQKIRYDGSLLFSIQQIINKYLIYRKIRKEWNEWKQQQQSRRSSIISVMVPS